MKLQSKISFTIFSLILFFGTAATITTFYLTHKEFTNQLTHNMVTNSIAQADEIYEVLRQSKDISVMLAGRPSVREYLTNPSNLLIKQQVESKYLDGFNLGGMYSAIYLLDSKGIGKVSTDPRFIGQDYSFRDYFTGAKNGNHTFNVAIGVTSKELGYYFATPIYSTRNVDDIVGVAVVKLNPKYIESSILEHNETGFKTLLTDELSIVIVSKDPAKLYRSLGKLPNSSLEKLQKNNTYGSTNFTPLDYDILMSYISSREETTKTFRIMDKLDDDEEVVSIVKIQDFPLYLIFEGSLKQITNISLKTSTVIAGFVAAAALASIIAIMFILRVLLRQQLENEQKIKDKAAELEKLNNLMVDRELRMIDLKKQLVQTKGSE